MSDTDRPTDDVEGHAFRRSFTEVDEPADDVDGHKFRRAFTDDDPADDVTGHLSGALGAQKRDEGL